MAFSIDLTGKVVLITGVSSGIGAGIAKMFAKANATIAGCALEDEKHKGVKAFYENVKNESGQHPFYFQCDVTSKENTDAFVELAYKKYGRIDILASNAGTNFFKGALDCSDEDWQKNIQLNLTSHWNLAKACRKYMLEKGGGVILINSSCHAFTTTAGGFPYNIAKTGLKAMVQSFTMEWSPSIRTVGIAPGVIYTELAEDYFNGFPDPDAEYQRTKDFMPLQRFGTPEEIGAWFVFLASDYAAFAGGQTYLVDGGRSAVMWQ
jgi:NAD(P)-dependent dehydrogenase (short-subunit alcohol dehydrogenase family)